MMSRKGLRSVLSSVLQPALRSALWPSVGGDGVGGGDAASPLIFSASLQNSLTPSKATGSPTPTFTRASSATFVDYAGVVKTVASNVPRFMGARLDGDGSTFHLTKVDGVTPIGAGDYYADSDGPFGYVAEGARTNICAVVNDNPTTTTGITKSGDAAATITVVDDAAALAVVGISGLCSAGKVYKLDNSAGASAAYAIINGAPASTAAHAYSAYVRRGNGLNVNLGYANITSITPVPSTSYTRVSALVATAVSGGNGRLTIAASPGAVAYFILFQLEVGSYISSVIPLSTAAAVTRSADAGSYATTSNITSANGVLYLEWTPPYTGMGTVALWGSYVDANNYTRIFHDGTNVVFRRRVSGVNYDATKALTYAAGTTYKIAARISNATGGDVFIAGVKGTNSPNTSALQLGANFSVGHDGNGANHSFAPIRNVKHYDTALTDEQVAAL